MDMNSLLALALYNGNIVRDNEHTQAREIVTTGGKVLKSWTKQQVLDTDDTVRFGYFKAPPL